MNILQAVHCNEEGGEKGMMGGNGKFCSASFILRRMCKAIIGCGHMGQFVRDAFMVSYEPGEERKPDLFLQGVQDSSHMTMTDQA